LTGKPWGGTVMPCGAGGPSEAHGGVFSRAPGGRFFAVLRIWSAMAVHQHTAGQHLALAWGRLRRLWLNVVRPGYVRESLSRRHGTCRRCGACCQLGSRCRHLGHDEGMAVCAAYGQDRPPNCGSFPIDARDLADRDLIEARVPCGYYWLPAEEPVRGAADRRELGGLHAPCPARSARVLAVGTRAMALVPAESGPAPHGPGSNQSSGESAR